LPDGGAAIGIANLDTGEKKYIEAGSWLEILRSTDDKTRTFRSITRTGIRGNGITITTWSYEGKRLEKKELPPLTIFVGADNEHAISPDGNKFLYYNFGKVKERDGGLWIYDINSKNKTCIVPKTASCGLSILMLEFLSDDEILIALGEDEGISRKDHQICIYSLTEKKLEVIYRPKSIERFKFALSKDKKYLAFYEGFIPDGFFYGYVNVLDLKSKKIIASVSGEPDKMIGNIDIHSDRYICYTHGHEVIVYDMETKESKSVFKYDEKLICYALKFQNKDTLCYQINVSHSVQDRDEEPLTFIDIKTGKVIKEVSFEHGFNGPLYIADDGKLLIANIGF